MSSLSILHFNDVYRVTPQKLNPTKPNETIDVTQFAALVDDLRNEWPQGENGKRDGLLLFSGDVFSPSVESSVTRGSHMVPVINQLGIDVTVTGNHDFDFGFPHLSKLIKDTNFPWILSNIIDTTTSRVPEGLQEFAVIERAGLRIGFIGLVEKEWIQTVSSWPSHFVYKSMQETGLALSKVLRDPNGEHRCDLVVALTHSRLPNASDKSSKLQGPPKLTDDIALAKQLFALSPSGQQEHSIENEHGVDLLLGGHDHIYYAPKGVDSWDNFDIKNPGVGAEDDKGDVLVVKSGTDFRDLSEINLELASTPKGSVRSKVITKITGKRHEIQPTYRKSEPMVQLLKKLLGSVSSALKAPLCRTTVLIDVRSSYIRTEESPVSNWIADILRHAYDAALCLHGCGGADGVLSCAGTYRGDSTYGPGFVTIGDILEILPFEDPMVVLEIDGEILWEAMEKALSTWPAQEGRFPSISGFRVSWDSRKEPGHRVLGIWLREHENEGIVEEPVENKPGGRKYKVVTREYMAQGHDGYDALKRGKHIIDDESGEMASKLVRQYMLGSQYVHRLKRLQAEDQHPELLSKLTTETVDAMDAERAKHASVGRTSHGAELWHRAAELVHQHWSKVHHRGHFKISSLEHMSCVDAFDGASARKGEECGPSYVEDNPDLLVVTPVVDGRLKDEGRVSNKRN